MLLTADTIAIVRLGLGGVNKKTNSTKHPSATAGPPIRSIHATSPGRSSIHAIAAAMALVRSPKIISPLMNSRMSDDFAWNFELIRLA